MGNENSKTRSQQRALILQHGRSDGYSNIVASRGNADARIISNGNAAAAMAKGPSGQAAAYTNGNEAYIYIKGDGKAGANGGTAWAIVNGDNLAVSYCDSAQKRSKYLEGSGSGTQAQICNCSECSSSCRCPCHYLQ